MDLPGWQALRQELRPLGLEIVTVALDIDREAPRRYVERAHPEHPSLIDQAHVLDELFGIVNVPSGVWIDENGTIVRPPETAFAPRPESPPTPPSRPTAMQAPAAAPPQMSPYMRAVLAEAAKLRVDREKYATALRDWARNGAASRYVLSPDEVLARSRPRPFEEGEAAAHFELGQHLYHVGLQTAAEGHFRLAHRLQPGNWTYKRQAWVMAHPEQGPTEIYDSDWLTDVQKAGAENYYPVLQMD
jgi:hypothetical protein